jgi:hypothetical protein
VTGVRPSMASLGAAVCSVLTLLFANGAFGSSEPLLRLARVEGIAYVAVSGPRGHVHRYGARGIEVSAREANGTVVATTWTARTGAFRLVLQGGRYAIAARVGPPTATPSRPCGAPTRVTLGTREHKRLNLVCSLR